MHMDPQAPTNGPPASSAAAHEWAICAFCKTYAMCRRWSESSWQCESCGRLKS